MPDTIVEPQTVAQALALLEREARTVAARTDLPDWVRARAGAVVFECREIAAALDYRLGAA
jgi:hypothetical protein